MESLPGSEPIPAVGERVSPTDFAQAAAALAGAAASGVPARVVGGGTKLRWGAAPPREWLQISTSGLNRTIEHNVGDLTASFEAGVPLSRARAELAEHGQMLAIDPPDSDVPGLGATIGGVFATADSGPLRHRYGQPRDLVLGMTVALSDGTIATSGGRVIKNVAGYDLAKLFTGSFGTLGMILSVNVRLHPLLRSTATAVGRSADPERITAAARALAQAPLELVCLDIEWRAGTGAVLARCEGVQAPARAESMLPLMRSVGLGDASVERGDDALWDAQRAWQRSTERAVVRVGCRPSELPQLIVAADACDGSLVGRAALGCFYVTVAPERVSAIRGALPDGSFAVVLDVPGDGREQLDRWGRYDAAALTLMRRVKERFDPAGVCAPGAFVGGI